MAENQEEKIKKIFKKKGIKVKDIQDILDAKFFANVRLGVLGNLPKYSLTISEVIE